MNPTAASAAKACTAHVNVIQPADINNQTAKATNYVTCTFYADQIYVTVSLYWSNYRTGPWTKIGTTQAGSCYGVSSGWQCWGPTLWENVPKDPCTNVYYFQARGGNWAKDTNGNIINVPQDKDTQQSACSM